MTKTPRWRIAAPVIVVTMVLGAAVLLLGRSRILGLLSTRDWVSFEIPPDVAPLSADIEVASSGVTVCNRGRGSWRNVLVQINDLYVAELDALKSGGCKSIAFRRFAMKSWKRIPGYPDMRVSRVEVLASESRRGYVSRSF